MGKLLVLRGAPGSGKSSVANYIHNTVIGESVLLPQDVFKVDFIKNNPALYKPTLDALEATANTYLYTEALVILEGVLSKSHWEEMIARLGEGVDAHYYFLETSVEKSVERAGSRRKASQIAESDVRLWHPKSNPLGLDGEKIIDAEHSTVPEIATQIASDLGLKLDSTQVKASFYSDSFHPLPQ